MTDYTVKRLARVLSLQAEVEAMKAANEARRVNDQSPAYNEGDFIEISNRLEAMAHKHDEQL